MRNVQIWLKKNMFKGLCDFRTNKSTESTEMSERTVHTHIHTVNYSATN